MSRHEKEDEILSSGDEDVISTLHQLIENKRDQVLPLENEERKEKIHMKLSDWVTGTTLRKREEQQVQVKKKCLHQKDITDWRI